VAHGVILLRKFREARRKQANLNKQGTHDWEKCPESNLTHNPFDSSGKLDWFIQSSSETPGHGFDLSKTQGHHDQPQEGQSATRNAAS
jgi:hypothetical protein